MQVPPVVHEVLRAPGQPLDPASRASLEPRFGHNFSRVRVHTDARAAESARAVNALAYTVGQDVVFGAGQYAPRMPAGQRLLAHELAHVAQQDSLPPGARPSGIGSRDSPSEKLAQETSARIFQPGWQPQRMLAAAPLLQRQPMPAQPQANPFSVDQAAYLQMVTQAIQQFSGPLVAGNTLSTEIQPILQAMLAGVTWRDQNGVDQGGSTVRYTLPGPPRLTLNLRLVLDDRPDPHDGGQFAHTGMRDGTLFIRIRANPTVNELATTLFHEGLHLAAWLINRPGPARITSTTPQAVRALTTDRFRHEISSLRGQLERLAQAVNPRRQATGQAVITSADLDRMAPWLMQEVQVRAETEVFLQLSNVQQQRRQGGPAVYVGTPQNTIVDLRMANDYIYEFSHVFQPGDRTGQTQEEREIVRRIAEMLEGFKQLQVRRRFDINAFIHHNPRPQIQYTPPPLTPPPFSPLPLPD